MLQDHSSNPVAFASAPLGSVIDPRSGRHGSSSSPSHRKPRSSPASDSSSKPSSSSKKAKHPSAALPPSNLGMISSSNSGSSSVGGQDSFYIVPPSGESSGSHDASNSSSSSSSSPTTAANPNPKTLEELTLENSSLRSSLDTLALHAQELERKLSQQPHLSAADPSSSQLDTPKAFKPTPLPPPPPFIERGDRSIMLGGSIVDLRRLKKEAEKAWRDEEKALKAVEVASKEVSPPTTSHSGLPTDQLKIVNLENEVGQLKAQNEKQRDTISKYKAQIDKIKVGARLRREAKASSAAGGEGAAAAEGASPAA
ncbi:hypothetical protein BDY24DRAFT_194275 [Mrakia frigida]|uniref:uncharacterized protein n=1 Tax=Mrakia frigida TaxID=29902 RepID=UPI003FCC1F78